MKNEAYKMKVDKPDQSLGLISDVAACMKKSEDRLRRTAHDLHTPIAQCTEADGGIWGTFTVKCNRSVISE